LAPYCNDSNDFYYQWLAARASSWHSQRISLMSHWLPQWMPWQSRVNFQWQTMDPNGFVPYLYADPPPEIRAEVTAKTHQQYAGSFAGFRPGAMSLRALRDLVAHCRSEKIPIAFLVPPVSPTFKGWFEPNAWRRGESDLCSFCRELDVELFPAPNLFEDSDFADGHHMLRNSAEHYSRWLAETYVREWCNRECGKSISSSK
jgi:hypothetical protein